MSTKTTKTVKPTEPTLAQLRADVVAFVGVTKTAAKKMDRDTLVARLEAHLDEQERILAEREANRPTEGEAVVGIVEAIAAGEQAIESAEEPERAVIRRPVRFTYVLADNTPAKANFATVENAERWGSKALERGEILDFQILADAN